MKQALYIGKEPNFQKIIITSAVLHVMFIALVAVPLKTKQKEYRSYMVNLVAPREITKKSGERPVAKAVTKKAPLKKRERSRKGVSFEDASKVATEIERLRAIRSLAAKQKKKEIEIAHAKKTDEHTAQEVDAIRKKILDQASEGQGIPSRATSLDSESYYAIITKHIWSEWIPPDYSATGLQVVISIRIGTDGKLMNQVVEESSGNSLFDRSATRAIAKASPFPPPPVEMEIGVRFYL